MRRSLTIASRSDRAQRRRRVTAENALLEDARQKTVASAVVAGEFAARCKAGRLHPSRNDGAICFESAAANARRSLLSLRARKFAGSWRSIGERFPLRIEFQQDDPNGRSKRPRNICAKNKLAYAGDQLVIISDMRIGQGRLIDCVQLRSK